VTQKSGADEGLKLLREAAAALPGNPDVQFHLAFALNETGDAAGALEILQRILADSAPFHERASAEALLTKLKG
jgi:cellulose synthase operon protein C